MKKRKLFLLLSLLGIMASCTNEQDASLPQAGQRGEIQIMFNGNGAQTDYPNTRAIATDAENRMDELDVYIFASTTETGTYYFVEKWSKGEGGAAGKNFVLTGKGVNRKASIFPTEYKGYPYLKLYCVANSKDLYDTTGSKVTLTPLAVSDGVVTTPDGTITTGTAMEGYSTASVDANPLAAPLPMAGVASTMVSSDYSLVTVEMVRRVARFDIVNDAATTNLTILKITPLNARPAHGFFKETPTGTLRDEYPEVDYTTKTNANNGTTPGAFYVYPTAKGDAMNLLIEGTYSGAPVAYYVKVAATPEPTVAAPNPTAAFIDVKTNNRYTLRIKDVREAGLTAMFVIEDWTLGGGMIVKPDNNVKPKVVEIKATPATPAYKDEVVDDTIHINANGSFTIRAQANGATRARITPIGFAASAVAWLKNVPANDKVTLTEEGLKQTELTFTTANTEATATAGQQALLTLYNEAAADDPALKQQYIVALPEVKGPQIIGWNGSKVNPYKISVDNTDPTKPVIHWYKVSVTSVSAYFKIDAPYAASVGSATTGLSPSYDATAKVLTVALGNPSSTKDGSFVLINQANTAKRTTVQVVFDKPAVPVVSAAGTNPLVSLSGTIFTIDVDRMKVEGASNTFELTIKTSEGTILPTGAMTGLSFAIKAPAAGETREKGETVYTVTVDTEKFITQMSPLFSQEISNATTTTLTFKKGTVTVTI